MQTTTGADTSIEAIGAEPGLPAVDTSQEGSDERSGPSHRSVAAGARSADARR